MSEVGSAAKRVVRVQRGRGLRRVGLLLDAAGLVFGEKGYDAATMTEIAARAGSSIGSLYQFFPTKEAIAKALSEQMLDILLQRLDDIDRAMRSRQPVDAPARLVEVFISLRDELPAFSALSDRPPPGSEHQRPLVVDAMQRICAQACPDVSERRQRAIAVTILSLCKVISSLTKDASPEEEKDAAEDLIAVMRMYLAAVGADAAT